MANSELQLVGGLLIGGNWDLDGFGKLFGRLTSEVKHTGELTRFIGYEGVAGEDVRVRFFGIEVSRIDDIPKGMAAWDISGDTWTVSNEQGVVWRNKLAWQWVDWPGSGRLIGEFTAPCPLEWSPSPLEFRLTAHAYTAPGGNLDDDVHLVDYDPSWPRQFEEMARWIREELGDAALRVEHYGSTAIPGMPAKPIIDILVEIPSFAEAHRSVLARFNYLEWEYWWYSGHMVFIKREKPMGQRTHHIHVAPADHEIWKGLAFRDYLISHPEEASRYAALKRELSARHRTDRERYTVAKSDFVREITAKALHGGG